MHREIKDGYVVTTYYGLPELMETASDATKKDAKNGVHVTSGCKPGRTNTDNWMGITFQTWEEMRTSAQTNWKYGLETVEEMRRELEQCDIPVPVDRRRKRRWSEDDGEVDVDRVIEGDSYCFQEVKRLEVSGLNVITLVVNIGGACMWSVERLFWRSAATVVLIDLLEEAGFSCEVIAWSKAKDAWEYDQNTNAFDIIRLKEAGEALDVSYMVNGLSPWAFRSGIFGSWHTRPNVTHNYGMFPPKTAHILPKEMEAQIGIDGTARAFHLAGKVFSRETAIEAARKILEQIGQKEIA